jgi:hypothetical protein
VPAGPRQHNHSRARVPRNSLRFEIPPTWRARSAYLYTPGTGWPSYTPRHWVPFSSLPTTRRATVEVFEPACTWGFSELNCAESYILSAWSTHRRNSSVLLRDADHIENTSAVLLRGTQQPDLLFRAGTCLPNSCPERDCITPLFYCCEHISLSNGYFCRSTVLACILLLSTTSRPALRLT